MNLGTALPTAVPATTPVQPPKPFYLTSYFMLLVFAFTLPLWLPPLGTFILQHSAFTADQQARYMAMIFDLCESAFKWFGTAFVLVRGGVSLVRVLQQQTGPDPAPGPKAGGEGPT